MARLYTNEKFPLPVVEELRRLGHEMLTTHEAGEAGDRVDDQDHRDHHEEHGPDLGEVAEVELGDELAADATGADEPQDGRGAHVDLEAEQPVADDGRQDLRDHAPPHLRDPPRR